MSDLTDKIALFPTCPGVYLMSDEASRIIYVGKAKDLRRRVKQYFSEHDDRYQVRFLMARVRNIEFVTTATESEALILENNLIKKHKPRYNVFLKDDKTYLGLRLSIKDKFPRLHEVRKIKADGAAYFGPYTSAEGLRTVKEFLNRSFQLRTCSDRELSARTRPCLEYQIGRCSAPCVDYISQDNYSSRISDVKNFLDGKSAELRRKVISERDLAAEELRFEDAARWRDLLSGIDVVLEKQNVAQLNSENLDAIACQYDGRSLSVAVLQIRNGNVAGSRHHRFQTCEDDNEALRSFLLQSYLETTLIPPEILIDRELPDHELVQDLLRQRAKHKVELHHPQRGEKNKLLNLAQRNLENYNSATRDPIEEREQALNALMTHFDLPAPPQRIECYDISNISGTDAVGSLVVFQDGEPDKASYKKFKIRTIEGPNDFAMLAEVFKRRFGEKNAKWPLPDLVIVDGGKGQLNAALAALAEVGRTGLNVIGIAKGQGDGARAKGLWDNKKEEEIYLPGRKNPLILKRGSLELQLLQLLRDESHRFAINYHRALRSKRLTSSWLDDVPGIGPARKRHLIKIFGSAEKVAEASVEELINKGKLTPATAQQIIQLR